MTINVLRGYVCAELGELWDAESELSKALPPIAAQLPAGPTRRLVQDRITQSKLHLERLEDRLTVYACPAGVRSCGRVRLLLGEFGRRPADSVLNQEEAVISLLIRIDDYSIAASIFAARCAEAIGDVATALTLTGLLVEKQIAKESLAGSSRTPLRRATEAADSVYASSRHRTWRANEPWAPDTPNSRISSPRHSPGLFPQTARRD